MSTAVVSRAGTREAALSEGRFIRAAGWAGIVAVIAYIVGFGLYLAAGSPPDFTDATRFTGYVHDHSTLIIAAALVFFGLDFVALLVWFVGVRDLIRSIGGAWGSVADLSMFAYVVGLAMALVGFALLIAATTEAATKGDAAVTRALWGGSLSMLGALTYILLVLVQGVYAFAVQRTAILPRWNAWIAWVAAVCSAAAIPTAFGGTGFYSQLGLAPLLLSLPGLAWNLGGAISMIRRHSAYIKDAMRWAGSNASPP